MFKLYGYIFFVVFWVLFIFGISVYSFTNVVIFSKCVPYTSCESRGSVVMRLLWFWVAVTREQSGMRDSVLPDSVELTRFRTGTGLLVTAGQWEVSSGVVLNRVLNTQQYV